MKKATIKAVFLREVSKKLKFKYRNFSKNIFEKKI